MPDNTPPANNDKAPAWLRQFVFYGGWFVSTVGLGMIHEGLALASIGALATLIAVKATCWKDD